MIKKIIPYSLILLMVGFMACSSSGSLLKKTQNKIANKNYDAAISAADSLIQKNPNNSLAYFYKGVALGQKGQALESPSEATIYFKRMNEAFQQAQEVASQAKKVPEKIGHIKSVKNSFWKNAHNRGIKFVQNDSLMATYENPLQRSLTFLHNAVVIQPTHAMTYQAIATISARAAKYETAANAQKKYISVVDSATARNYLLLAQYYRKADMAKKGVQVLSEAQNKFPQNSQIVAFLADAYTQLGKTEKAIALVRTLVEQNPENPQYRLSLGSRLLIAATNLQEKYKANIDKIFKMQRSGSGSAEQIANLKQENKELRNQINQLLAQAEEQYITVLKYKPNSATAYNNLGIIYQVKASSYYGLRNLAQTRSEYDQYDQKADDMLREAMTYYEKAVEIKPENAQYWRRLYVVYLNLGLDKKANEAAKKAGIK